MRDSTLQPKIARGERTLKTKVAEAKKRQIIRRASNIEEGVKPKANKQHPLKGIFAMILGSSFMAIMAVFVKAAYKYTELEVAQVLYFRSIFMFLGALGHAKIEGTRFLHVPRD